MATNLTGLYKPKGSDKLSTFVDGMAANMAAIEKAYPVGSMWISTDKTSPANIIGGQWKAIGSGRVLVTVGVDNFYWDGDSKIDQKDDNKPGQTGGQKRHTHLNSMGFDGGKAYFRLDSDMGNNPVYGSTVHNTAYGFNIVKSYDIPYPNEMRLAYTRENSNYPPYYTVYMWERTG